MRNEIFPLLDSVFGQDWRNKMKQLGSQSNEWGNYIDKYIINPWLSEVKKGKAGIIIPLKDQPILIYSNVIMKSLHSISQSMLKKSSLEKINNLLITKHNKLVTLDGTLKKLNSFNLAEEQSSSDTINNTYNIIALGHENLIDVFSKKEKMAILKYRYCSLPHLVEYTHFNDKYPQFKNILITNTQNTLAYKFDNKKKKFITVNKNDLLDDIIDERMCDLSSFYDELENDLDEKTKEILEIVKEKIESDSAYKELKKKDIKLIIYNNRLRLVDLATLDTHREKVDKDSTNDLELEV